MLKTQTAYLIISFKWNFLAETTIRTLPEEARNIFVLHNGKSDEKIGMFAPSKKVDQLVYREKSTTHGAVLDWLLVRDGWPELSNHDRIVCVDHDLYCLPWMSKRIAAMIWEFDAAGKAIAASSRPSQAATDPDAEGWPYRYWTIPFFIASARKLLGQNVSFDACRERGRIYDTGQYMAEFRPDLVHLASTQVYDCAINWSSHWHSGIMNDDTMRRLSAHYLMLTHLGYFRPSEGEWEEMKTVPWFEQAYKMRQYARTAW